MRSPLVRTTLFAATAAAAIIASSGCTTLERERFHYNPDPVRAKDYKLKEAPMPAPESDVLPDAILPSGMPMAS